MLVRWCSEFARTGCVLPPIVLLPSASRHFGERSGGGRNREAEPDLKAFFECSADPLLVLDPSLRVCAINAAACRALATTPEMALNAPALEVRMLARLLAGANLPERQVGGAQAWRTEVSIPDSEGQPLLCKLESLPLTDGKTLIHLQDITPLLKARRSLEDSERVHRTVFQANPATSWNMALPEERLLEVSGAVERMFGYEPADFRRRPELWDELVHPADRERVRGEFRHGLATGQPFEIRFTGLHRDHHDLPALVNRVVPIVDAQGWMGRCEGFIEDRSDPERLETRLRATETQLRNIVESVSSGVLVLGPGAEGPQVTLCNRRFAQLLGLDAPLEPGTPIDRLPAEAWTLLDSNEGAGDFAKRLTSDAVGDGIIELKRPQRVLRRYAGPVRDPLGAVVGRILTVEDATAAWLLQRRLTHAEKMESMGRLAGGVGHDFNNLLGAIMGFAALTLEDTPEGDPRREPLSHIVDAAQQASKLTGALLSFSREARYERVPVSLNRVIEESYLILRSGLDPSIAIELALDSTLPPLLGDALLFQQMIVHLAQEAKDQLGSSGVLRLETRVSEEQRSPAAAGSASAARRMVCVEVSAVRAGDADPRPSRARIDPSESGGLALATVEDIVRAHGGYLHTSLDRDRVRFQAMLPLAVTGDAPPFVPEVATAHGHETVLVVDDEPGLRLLAKAGLQQRGYDVVLVESGEQALELIGAGTPAVDLVLLDLAMPGMPGEKVLEALRRVRPDLPVIIASGYASMESQSSWIAAGAAGFVAKPYRVQDVALKMREVLDRVHGGAMRRAA